MSDSVFHVLILSSYKSLVAVVHLFSAVVTRSSNKYIEFYLLTEDEEKEEDIFFVLGSCPSM